ncbi:MAG: response regulator [Ktedonobacteraceae bacterium]|nr:response regulator [Ktedonobacteraceae bacterium]
MIWHRQIVSRGVETARKLREQLALRKLQILFVDSDVNTYEKMQLALGEDFTLQHLPSVAGAVEHLRQCLPDILISEVAVGQEDGLDLCRYIRSTPSLAHLPILLLTSRSTLADKVAGFSAGADDYVVKPFDVHHLRARIRLLARIKRLEQHL